MVKPSSEREMDGTKYRFLSRRDYHLYLSDEVCRQKGYQFDKNDDLFKWDAEGNKVWVTAVIGWLPGDIPTGGAVIFNDLTGEGRQQTVARQNFYDRRLRGLNGFLKSASISSSE